MLEAFICHDWLMYSKYIQNRNLLRLNFVEGWSIGIELREKDCPIVNVPEPE